VISKKLDNSTIKKIEENDLEEILEDIMISYGDELTRLAYTYVKDLETAKDIVQSVFLKCYTHLGTFKGDSKLKTWLYRITINKCKDYIRSSYFKRFKLFDKFTVNKSKTKFTPEDEVINLSTQVEVKKMVLNLPTKYSEVILLYYYEELDINEIADILQVSSNTVKTRLRRGRQNLMPLLKEEYFK
jgi:RNA polymerase sigma-70 factor, ECF subfamily